MSVNGDRRIFNGIGNHKNGKEANVNGHHHKHTNGDHNGNVMNGEVDTQYAPKKFQETFEKTSLLSAVLTYINYAILTVFGFLRDFMRNRGFDKTNGVSESEDMKDFVPLYASFESFYTRNVYIRIRDCFNRPICSVPGATVDVAERKVTHSGWTVK